jgi:hypothetical protein
MLSEKLGALEPTGFELGKTVPSGVQSNFTNEIEHDADHATSRSD